VSDLRFGPGSYHPASRIVVVAVLLELRYDPRINQSFGEAVPSIHTLPQTTFHLLQPFSLPRADDIAPGSPTRTKPSTGKSHPLLGLILLTPWLEDERPADILAG
jgi:hypothetical protein